jgi:hypothetical protein
MTITLTPRERDIVVHALRTQAELFEDSAIGLGRHQAQEMAHGFRRQAVDARALADRIEQVEE